jgi:hypothetical protein
MSNKSFGTPTTSSLHQFLMLFQLAAVPWWRSIYLGSYIYLYKLSRWDWSLILYACVRGTDIVVDDIIQQLSFYLCYQTCCNSSPGKHSDSISKRYHLWICRKVLLWRGWYVVLQWYSRKNIKYYCCHPLIKYIMYNIIDSRCIIFVIAYDIYDIMYHQLHHHNISLHKWP